MGGVTYIVGPDKNLYLVSTFITKGEDAPVGPTIDHINFYGKDGELVKSYSLSQLPLTELPQAPYYEGLTFQGWSSSLSTINAATGPIDIYPIYTTTDGKTHIFIEIASFVTDFLVDWRISSTSGGTVDWGDGTPPDSFGVGNITLTHTYARGGNYEVKIKATNLGFQEYAFCGGVSGNSNGIVKKVYLSTKVKSIGNYAFSNCRSLSSITIPEGVTSIGDDAFYNCRSLSSITLPNTVTSIGNSAFWNCSSLSSITISEGVASIGVGAFAYCSSLNSVTIPNTVTSIGAGAFGLCASLSSITIPESVTTIEREAFSITPLYAIQIKSVTPPTLENSNAIPNNEKLKIYVPYSEDHSILNNYKVATNWSAHANKLVEYQEE